MDLSRFLLMRISEDIAVITQKWGSEKKVGVVRSSTDAGQWFFTVAIDEGDAWVANGTEVQNPSDHTILFDPKKALSVLEAQRTLVHMYVVTCHLLDINLTMNIAYANNFEGRKKLLESSLKDFAAAYSEHPDYQKEWAVDYVDVKSITWKNV